MTPAPPTAKPTQPTDIPPDLSEVARIRAAIADGTYRVDPGRLADALLAAGVLDPERTP